MTATQAVRKPSRPYLRRGHTLADDLAFAMPFFAEAGTVTRDVSGHQRTGTFNGDPTWVVGPWGPALDFDGTGDYVETVGYTGISGAESRTIVMWVKNAGAANDETMLGYGGANNGERYDFRTEVKASNDGRLRIEVQGGFLSGNTNFVDDNWHQVGVVFPDGASNVTEHLLYVDGVQDTTANSDGHSVNTGTATDVSIGRSPQMGRQYEGKISNVLFYHRALKEEEMERLHQDPFLPYITKPR